MFPDHLKNRDVVITGAGLAGSLLALRLKMRRPDLRLLLIDRSSTGNLRKTWSCHASDLEEHEWACSLAEQTWPGYEVQFPKYRRRLESAYVRLTPQRLEAKLRHELGDEVRFDCEVHQINPTSVVLKDGTRIHADVVIDSTRSLRMSEARGGFQKFAGCELRFTKPHGLREPILMDANVEQIDGFRFFYVLPLTDQNLLIEDTRFSQTAEFVPEAYFAEVLSYAHRSFGERPEILKQEFGVLPLPFAFEPREESSAPSIGMAAGFFHVVTGYSVPMALDVADAIADLPTINEKTVRTCLRIELAKIDRERSYFHLLNKMMFRACEAPLRYRIFERFYSMTPSLIARFYKGHLSFTDKARILIGRPPVPLLRALSALLRNDSNREALCSLRS